MIWTLLITIIIETFVIIGYAQIAKKPVLPILLCSVVANILTQSALWAALLLFPEHYRLTLFSMEFFIVGIEAFILFAYKKTALSLRDSFLLSLLMNSASFVIGWFLPI